MSVKRARRPDDRPDEILAAALDVFSEKGFAAARMDDVAKRAGLSKGAVYLYFDSKEALLEELVRRSAGRVVEAATQFVEQEGPIDAEAALRQVLTFIAAAMADEKFSAAPRLVLAEAQRSPRIAKFYFDEVISRGGAAVAKLLAIGVDAGAFRDIDPRVAVRCVAGPMIASMVLAHVFNDPHAPPPDQLAEGVADFVLNGLKPRPEAA